MCRKLCHFIWGIWWFHRSKYFEAMKVRKLAIWPWLVCQYNENTLMDLPSSIVNTLNWDVVIPILWIKLKIWENKHCVLPIMRAMGWSCSSDIQWWRPTVVDARGAPKATTVWEKPIKVKLALIITLICYSYTCLTWLWNRGRLLIWSLKLNENFFKLKMVMLWIE